MLEIHIAVDGSTLGSLLQKRRQLREVKTLFEIGICVHTINIVFFILYYLFVKKKKKKKKKKILKVENDSNQLNESNGLLSPRSLKHKARSELDEVERKLLRFLQKPDEPTVFSFLYKCFFKTKKYTYSWVLLLFRLHRHATPNNS